MASLGVKPISSSIGQPLGERAGWREPYESRGSRTVLRERGGAIPPRHSPTAYTARLLLMIKTNEREGTRMDATVRS